MKISYNIPAISHYQAEFPATGTCLSKSAKYKIATQFALKLTKQNLKHCNVTRRQKSLLFQCGHICAASGGSLTLVKGGKKDDTPANILKIYVQNIQNTYTKYTKHRWKENKKDDTRANKWNQIYFLLNF